MRKITKLFLVALPLLFAACGDGSSPTDITAQSYLPKSDFKITVTKGATPVISWPGARGFSVDITVDPKDRGKVTISQVNAWSFYVYDDGFNSPLTYGVFPENSLCSDSCAVQALVRGVTYDIVIILQDDKIGYGTFKI